jgi:hypothetical protein
MIDRRECAECGVHTTEFGCQNCGSTRLEPVAMSPADHASPDTPLELHEMPLVTRRIAARVAITCG